MPVIVMLQDAPEDLPYPGVAFPDGTVLPVRDVDRLIQGDDVNPFLSVQWDLDRA